MAKTLILRPTLVLHPGQEEPAGWLAATATLTQRANDLLVELTERRAVVADPVVFRSDLPPATSLIDEHNNVRHLRKRPGTVLMVWSMGVGHGRDTDGSKVAGFGVGDGTWGQTTIRGEFLKAPDAPIMLYYTLHELIHALGLGHTNFDARSEPCRFIRIMCYSHSNWMLWYKYRKFPKDEIPAGYRGLIRTYGLSLKETGYIQSLSTLEDTSMTLEDTSGSFEAEYPGAQVIPAYAGNYGYGTRTNTPKAIVLHTPEEPADDWESTPNWFKNPSARVSTHYYLDNDGDVIQMVPESQGAYAQGVRISQRTWKGAAGQLPPWAETSNLNLWAISIEMEGMAVSIYETMPRHSVQWEALLLWIKYVVTKYNIPLDRDHIVGHDEIASHKRDPGKLFDWDALMEDLNSAVEQPEPEPEEEEEQQPEEEFDRSSVIAGLRSARDSIDAVLRLVEEEEED